MVSFVFSICVFLSPSLCKCLSNDIVSIYLYTWIYPSFYIHIIIYVCLYLSLCIFLSVIHSLCLSLANYIANNLLSIHVYINPSISSYLSIYLCIMLSRPATCLSPSGSTQEKVTEGGEVEFIQQMIKESQLLKDRVRWDRWKNALGAVRKEQGSMMWKWGQGWASLYIMEERWQEWPSFCVFEESWQNVIKLHWASLFQWQSRMNYLFFLLDLKWILACIICKWSVIA